MNRNLKIGVLIAAIFLIILGINYFSTEGKIKQANINGYAFLESVSKCNIIYKIDVSTGKSTPNFEEVCFENALSYLNKIPFEPGEVGEGKLIVESEEYYHCFNVKNMEGLMVYRECIKELMPILEEKYPEVAEE